MKSLFAFDENGESLLYKDNQWKKRYSELDILYIDDNDVYIQAFEKRGITVTIFLNKYSVRRRPMTTDKTAKYFIAASLIGTGIFLLLPYAYVVVNSFIKTEVTVSQALTIMRPSLAARLL